MRAIPRAKPITLKLLRFTFQQDYFTFYSLNIDRPIKELTIQNVSVLKQIVVETFRFPVFQNLTTLNLIELPLIHLYENTFAGLSELKTLTIDGTHLRRFISNFNLSHRTKLEQLSIHGRAFQGPALFVFSDNHPMQMLHYVSITNFNLNNTLKYETFEGLMNVSMLILRDNCIESIGKNVFDPILETLKVLDLSGNLFRQLPTDIFQRKLPHNLTIYLENNKFDYKCDLTMMKLLVNQYSLNAEIEFQKQLPTENRQKYMENVNATKQSLENHLLKFAINVGIENERTILDVSILNSITLRVLFDYPPLTECQSNGMAKEIVITKAMEVFDFNEPPIDRLLLNVHYFPEYMALIEIQTDINLKHIVRCFSNINDGRIKSVQLKLERMQIYQYCWFDKDKNTINPLNCVAFFTHTITTDVWLTIENRADIIIGWTLLGIFAFLTGIAIALIASILFPRQLDFGENESRST